MEEKMHISEEAIERTIDNMWKRFDEPISLDELAEGAFLSKFYYSRVFRMTTGTSPGRFLTAIRVFTAKRMLLSTRASVTEVAYGVGYNSVGTFTSRFTRSVGVSPARYRQLAYEGLPRFRSFELNRPDQRICSVSGTVRVSAPEGIDESSRVYVAAFSSPIVEGTPQACRVLDSTGPFRVNLPDGEWFIRAAVVSTRQLDSNPPIRLPSMIGSAVPVRIGNGIAVPASVDIELREATSFDLPILMALPELDNWQIPQPEMAFTG
jgi:AraC family transcriptional regulator